MPLRPLLLLAVGSLDLTYHPCPAFWVLLVTDASSTKALQDHLSTTTSTALDQSHLFREASLLRWLQAHGSVLWSLASFLTGLVDKELSLLDAYSGG